MSGAVDARGRSSTAAGDVGVAPPRYRLPAATRPGRVRLQVADLGRSLAWYRRVLGLEVLDRSAGAARLIANEGVEPLLELRERPGAKPVGVRGGLGLYHYALLLPDRPSLGAFLRHLADLDERAGASDHRVSEALYLRDPDGLGVEVYADRPRGGWEVQDREIRMATHVLDARSLAGAARGPWTGMPRGTTVGHLHLHVRDLEQADLFYHRGLGLDRVVWSYPGALFLSAGGYHHHLGLNTWAADGSPASDDDARLIDWELVLPSGDDVDAAAASLRSQGHEVASDDGEARVSDPWGTALRLTHGVAPDG